MQQTINATNEGLHNEWRKRTGKYTHDEPFIDPRYRKPDITADADISYEQRLREHSMAKFGLGGQGFYDYESTTINLFDHYHKFMLKSNGEVFNANIDRSMLKHAQLIDRCFWHNSVEDIMEALRKEADPFAATILKRMEANSMLSMKTALKMVREARNMDYGEVLKMELNVALNKAKDSETAFGVKNVLLKPSSSKIENPGFSAQISSQQVESLFETNKYLSQIDLKIVENALLPTRHFFEKFTDSVRVYINETSTP